MRKSEDKYVVRVEALHVPSSLIPAVPGGRVDEPLPSPSDRRDHHLVVAHADEALSGLGAPDLKMENGWDK